MFDIASCGLIQNMKKHQNIFCENWFYICCKSIFYYYSIITHKDRLFQVNYNTFRLDFYFNKKFHYYPKLMFKNKNISRYIISILNSIWYDIVLILYLAKIENIDISIYPNIEIDTIYDTIYRVLITILTP